MTTDHDLYEAFVAKQEPALHTLEVVRRWIWRLTTAKFGSRRPLPLYLRQMLRKATQVFPKTRDDNAWHLQQPELKTQAAQETITVCLVLHQQILELKSYCADLKDHLQTSYVPADLLLLGQTSGNVVTGPQMKILDRLGQILNRILLSKTTTTTEAPRDVEDAEIGEITKVLYASVPSGDPPTVHCRFRFPVPMGRTAPWRKARMINDLRKRWQTVHVVHVLVVETEAETGTQFEHWFSLTPDYLLAYFEQMPFKRFHPHACFDLGSSRCRKDGCFHRLEHHEAMSNEYTETTSDARDPAWFRTRVFAGPRAQC